MQSRQRRATQLHCCTLRMYVSVRHPSVYRSGIRRKQFTTISSGSAPSAPFPFSIAEPCSTATGLPLIGDQFSVAHPRDSELFFPANSGGLRRVSWNRGSAHALKSSQVCHSQSCFDWLSVVALHFCHISTGTTTSSGRFMPMDGIAGSRKLATVYIGKA